MSFNFKASLRLGQLGESMFYQAHAGELERLDGFKSDFKLIETGQGLEIKSDYWSVNDTPNFFMERYSDKDKQSPGGPWQALKNESHLFVYMYVVDMVFYKFETKKLVNALNEIIKTLKPTDVPNKTYITQGYRVPRELLEDIATVGTIKIKKSKL